MGKRGKPKTPTAILKARGSWRGETREGEPEPGGQPDPPAWLSDRASALWAEAVPKLTGIGVATCVDSNALARYVTMLDQWMACTEFIADHGMTYEDPRDDTLKEYPHVSRASRLSDQLLKIEQQYGMTASARASLATDTGRKPKEANGIGSLINPKLKLA